MQPFIPALEYYFFKEYIIEHHCVNKDNPDIECDGLCYLNKKIDESHHDHEDHKISTNVKYYPGTVLDSSGLPIPVRPNFKQKSWLTTSQQPLQGWDRPPVPPPRANLQKDWHSIS